MVDELGLVFITLAAAFALVLFLIGAFFLRRTQLRWTLGTVEASLCLPPGGWQMGMCRYTDQHLEWLRLMSLSPCPRHRYLRSSLRLRTWRHPTEAEKARVQPGAVIVVLDYRGEELLLAMNYNVYAGLSSWLEAGPVIGVGTWR